MHLSESTWVSVKTVLPVILSVLGAALWIVKAQESNKALVTQEIAHVREEFKGGLSDVRADARVAAVHQQAVAVDVTELKAELQSFRVESANNRWTRADMVRWAQRLAAENANTIKVPSVDN